MPTKSLFAHKPQKLISNLLKPVLNSLIIVLLGAGFVIAGMVDDASFFIDAFSAYQKKDYLLAIEKITALDQRYPDTPLRDVTLLLLARSSLKAGNNELAAKSFDQFSREYDGHPFQSTTDDELRQLSMRLQMGEILAPNTALLSAAQKTRGDRLARWQSSTGTDLNEPSAYSQAEPVVLTHLGFTPGKSGEHRTAGTITPDEIKTAISMSANHQVVAVGQSGSIPFQLINQGLREEDFMLEVHAPEEYEARMIVNGSPVPLPLKVSLGKASQFRGIISYRMPPLKLDGQKGTLSFQATSTRFQHIVQAREIQVIAAAPLVRVVARPLTSKPAAGEKLLYRVTILNVGTVADRELTARLFLPEQIEFIDAAGSAYHREPGGAIAFTVDSLETGKLAEFTMNVKVREKSSSGQLLRSRIEIEHGKLALKEEFTSLATVIR